jgi:hypothetical protein
MAKVPVTKKTRPAPAIADDPVRNQEQEALAPLNFKVAREFRREFKTFASQHDMKMVELLQEGFRLVKKHRDG